MGWLMVLMVVFCVGGVVFFLMMRVRILSGGMTGIRDLPPLLNGILAGLVPITASADCVDSWASVIIGVVGAFAYSIGSRAILAYEVRAKGA